MSVIDGALRESDIEVLGRLHFDTLPDSLVSVVGERYARAFYRYVASSPDEVVFLERGGPDGGPVVGACIVSMHPERLNYHLVRSTPLLPMALMAVARLMPRLWRRARLAGSDYSAVKQPVGPEIILIFTLPTLRSRGCGAQLLSRAETWLGNRGVTRLYVKTRDSDDNRAIGFYLRSGFQKLGFTINRGKRLVLFGKTLGRGHA